ncbi:MAG: hypothetical protein NC418_06070 [Muribaculaceae bacterium]|nr:hypothetical protein [Muribaculaceae bacterium]
MKNFRSLWLLLLALCTGLSASALKVSFAWDIPGSVIIKQGSSITTAVSVDIPADATSFTAETEGTTTIPYTYIFPAEGYVLTGVELPNGTKPAINFNESYGGQYWGRNYTSGFIKDWGSDPVVKISCEKLVRNDSFTIEIENGAKCVSASLSGLGQKPTLSDGLNTIHFNPALESDLTLAWVNGATDFFSLTRGGEAVTTKKFTFSSNCTLSAIQPGEKIVIRVFENDEQAPADVTLTVDFAEGLEDCLNNICDWSNSVFTSLTDGKITVSSGTDLQFNFKEDYTFTKFTLGADDITSSFNSSNRSLRFKVTADCTLKVEGAPTAYDDVEFTAYVMNPQGVNLYQGQYQANPADLSAGEALTADVELSDFTLTAADSRRFRLAVSAKKPYVYIAPKEGWFIATVQAKEGAKFEPISSAGPDYTTFYVIALPLENSAKLDVNVTGGRALKLSPNAALSNSWDNPSSTFSIKEGASTIDFNPLYHAPFSLRPLESFNNFEAYLDGKKLVADDNGNYEVAPYTGADKASVLTVFADGTSTGKINTTTVTANGLSAEASFGALAHPIVIGTATKYLSGTVTTVKPEHKDCAITLNGTLVHGIADDGSRINGLNEAGEYVFTPTGTKSTVVITAQKFASITDIKPADGATVKALSSLSLTIPVISDEQMIFSSDEALAGITVTDSNGDAVSINPSLGEIGMNEDYTAYVYPVNFGSAVTEAGTYTVVIPEGTFYEVQWDDAAGDFVKVDGGFVTPATTLTYTVDPAMKSKLENFYLTPASGTAVKSLRVVYVNFPDFTAYDMTLQADDEPAITFTKGDVTVNCMFGPNWDSSDFRSFMIVPCDADYNETPLTADGTWTLTIPEGTFVHEGELSKAIEATFTIGADLPAYPISPVPGSVTGNLSKLTINFPGAYSVEYADKAITLEGADFTTATTFVSGTGTEFYIQFGTLPTVAGDYTVTIPEGAFTIDGEPSEAVSATFTYEPIWKLSPEAGAQVESLTEIIIEFPKATSAEFVGNEISFILTNGSTYAAPGMICEAVEGSAHPAFRVSLSPEAQQPPMGTITFIAAEGSFIVDGEECPEIKASYVLEHAVATGYTVDPADHVLVFSEYGCMWTFIFDESAQLSAASAKDFASQVKVTLNGADLVYDSDYMAMFESNMLLMGIVNSDVLKAGELKVSIPAGAILVSGTPAPAIEETFTVVAPKAYTFTTDPADGATVNSLASITVAFPEAATAELFNRYGISLTRGYDYRAQSITVTELTDAAVPTFKIDFTDAPDQAGAYTFACRIGTFTLDTNQESPEISISLNFQPQTGIDGITASPDGRYTVVSIAGRVILTDASADEVKALPHGFYIINGKKAAVK